MSDPWPSDPWSAALRAPAPAAAPPGSPASAGGGASAGVSPSPAPSGLAPEDFAALLCSRICHDLISPVGAIGNGVELMREIERGSDGTELKLIGRSAEMASAYLQFFRIAFGAAPPGDAAGLSATQRTARNWFEFHKPDLAWPSGGADLTRASARLMFNFMQIAVSALPRGGLVQAEAPAARDGGLALRLRAEGPVIAPAPLAAAWLAGDAAADAPAAREVHYLAAASHARAAEAPIRFETGEGFLTLSATIPAGV